ncbi:MAG: PAS domain S-box protein [Chloroflexota bacterium]|nr:MAG: PAS domain S-box protein [Chloroflexota bacterium]
MDKLLSLLAEFGGGGSDPGDNAVRFLLPAFFWSVLAYVALRQWRSSRDRKDVYIGVAALVGLFRELLMFVVFYGDYVGLVPQSQTHSFYPPLEHAATGIASFIVAYAFLRYFTQTRRLSRIYLTTALGATLLLYVVSAPTWSSYLRKNPNALFGQHWSDMAFSILGVALMAAALGILVHGRKRGVRIPWALWVGFVFFLLDDVLMIANLATAETSKAFYAPIRHNLHIWAIPFFLAVYWTEMGSRLAEVERAKDSIFRLSPSLLCVADFSGRIQLASPASAQILGYTPEELVGRRLTELGYPPDRVFASSGARATSVLQPLSFVRPYTATDGSDRWLHWIVQPVGEEAQLYSVVSDITERKRAEEALQKAHEELELRVKERTAELANTNEELRLEIEERQRVEKLMEEYVHAISHDLRSPLTVIQGQAQLLERTLTKTGLTGRELNSIRAILHGAHRMNGMIQDLADSARLESGQVKLNQSPLELHTFVLDLKERLTGLGDADRIRVEAPQAVPLVSADPDRLERILMNLLGNALKYSAPDTEVLVALSVGTGEVTTSVSDQGIGIESEELPYVFERYRRAPSALGRQEGLGLGLYITKGLVEAHGGRIWAESEPGKGSAFHFTLPQT